ncbi:flagellin N-terminal helical domain-containing protein [Arenibacterium sp. CAU 1754]
MSSILTNNSAMVALQTLKSINSNLEKTQDEISTGKSIASAKDGSAVWAISKVMESDVSGFEAVSDALSLGESTVAVASAGAEQVVNVLQEIKQLAVSANSENVDFGKVQADIDERVAQVASIISAAQFNGANLLATDVDGNGATSLSIVSSLDRVGAAAPTTATISVATVDFEADIDLATNLTAITDTATAATALGEVETFLQTAIDGAAALGASSKRIEDQNNFVSKLSDAMKSGIGAMVDADMESASARLQALQTQQQLGVQALSIANQAPQTLLSLFR